MKKVYTHTFSDEREKLDLMIDNYFKQTLGIKEYKVDMKKYKAWLMLFEKNESNKTLNEFKLFMQHEMQHIKKEP